MIIIGKFYWKQTPISRGLAVVVMAPKKETVLKPITLAWVGYTSLR